MKIQYCSDLHLEFASNRKFFKNNLLQPVGDILLLAGDIVPFAAMDKHKDFFDFVSDNFECTYWIPGNHEYYGADIFEKANVINETIRSNVFLVNNQVIYLKELNLICTTLWSDLSPLHHFTFQKRLSDFYEIRHNGMLFLPAHFHELHLQAKRFLENALALEATVPLVVMTHHLPTFLHYPEKYRRSPLNEAFATELTPLIESSAVDYWIYGHHHVNIPSFKIGRTALTTNQLGYVNYKENIGFSRCATIEL